MAGLEYVEALVQAMDLPRMERADASLGLPKSLHARFKQWERS